MKTTRRLYFYLLSLISTQVVIWAVVSLLRTIFDHEVVPSTLDWLSGGIAFVAVGVPIFWLHWTTVQRDAQHDQEEASSRIRALFLYVTALATGIPITYALLAILNRLIVTAMGLPATFASLGGDQTHLDNLLAIAVNLIVLVYFWRVLQQDWKSVPDQENLADFRRLHRKIWMVYGLGLLVLGVQQILRYIFSLPQEFGRAAESALAAGLAFVLVGLPIFWKAWSVIQKSLSEKIERSSSLRMVVLFLLSFLGIGFGLAAAGVLLANGLRWAFQVDTWNILSFIDNNGTSLSVLISMGFVWVYFRRELKYAIADHDNLLQQASYQRIYNSILSLAGLVVTFLGILFLLGTIIENLYNLSTGNNAAMLSNSLALLVIGVPLWFHYWQAVQQETSRSDEVGAAARKSVLRKAYLYLVLFGTVVGSMLSAGWWIYGILNALLGRMPVHFWMDFFQQLRVALLFAVFLVYHLRVLRADGRENQQEKEVEVSEFSVLVIQASESSLGNDLVHAIQQKSPHLNVSIVPIDSSGNLEPIPQANLVLIPSSLVVQPPEKLQTYLQNHSAKILVIPQEQENWYWLGVPDQNQKKLIQEAASAVQNLSENHSPRAPSSGNPWMTVVYILAGLFTLQTAILIIALLASLFL